MNLLEEGAVTGHLKKKSYTNTLILKHPFEISFAFRIAKALIRVSVNTLEYHRHDIPFNTGV